MREGKRQRMKRVSRVLVRTGFGAVVVAAFAPLVFATPVHVRGDASSLLGTRVTLARCVVALVPLIVAFPPLLVISVALGRKPRT